MSRIQYQRKAGWSKPPDAIYVGRPPNWQTRFDHWGSPFLVAYYLDLGLAETRTGAHHKSVLDFADWLVLGPSSCLWQPQHAAQWEWMHTHRSVLTHGRPIVCWCRLNQPCHGDILLAWANPPETFT